MSAPGSGRAFLASTPVTATVVRSMLLLPPRVRLRSWVGADRDAVQGDYFEDVRGLCRRGRPLHARVTLARHARGRDGCAFLASASGRPKSAGTGRVSGSGTSSACACKGAARFGLPHVGMGQARARRSCRSLTCVERGERPARKKCAAARKKCALRNLGARNSQKMRNPTSQARKKCALAKNAKSPSRAPASDGASTTLRSSYVHVRAMKSPPNEARPSADPRRGQD